MAEHLASIFGTEKDRVNCPFYFKIGACRHGDRCSRLHTKPSVSPTLLLSNMYQRPDMITPGVDAQGNPIDPRKIQDHFECDVRVCDVCVVELVAVMIGLRIDFEFDFALKVVTFSVGDLGMDFVSVCH
ncbi:putative transcription factor C3H family [Helianthus annuus]|nr:putative transcription factor C3H family [Helianthus annuus]